MENYLAVKHTIDAGNTIDESQNDDAEWKKPDKNINTYCMVPFI